MSDAFDQFLQAELKSIDEAGLLRSLRRIETPQQVEVYSGDLALSIFLLMITSAWRPTNP